MESSSVLSIAHYILIGAYALLPAGAVIVSTWLAVRRQNAAMSRVVTGTIAGGIAIGTVLVVTYALFVGGRLSIWEMVMAAYLATSLLMMLKLFDWLASWPLRSAIGAAGNWATRLEESGEIVRGMAMPRRIRIAITSAALLRVAILVTVGMPAAMGAVMVYRPHVTLAADPLRQGGFPYRDVQFDATDGTRIAGWWIPADAQFTSKQTVILCHGFGGGATSQIAAAKRLVPAGYNVLLFDFRGHGRSDGHLISFGDLERRDVLGAVKWLQAEQPEQSRRIVGLGVSTGGAALLAAAGDDSAEGRAIEAVAVYGAYDSAPELMKAVAHARFIFPFNHLMGWIGLPVASLHVGTDLNDFVPARYAELLWPRPLLVMHGQTDELVPFDRGQTLYQRAGEPKRRVWLPGADRKKPLDEDGGIDAAIEFFNEAKPVPWV